MSILIISVATDIHAATIKYLLDKEAIPNDLFIVSDLPNRVRFSWRMANKSRWRFNWRNDDGTVGDGKYNVAWNRRTFPPHVPADTHPADAPHVHRHNLIASGWLKRSLLSTPLAINDTDARDRARSKLEQLYLAAEVGMTVPDTLFSNDKGEIAQFANSGPTIAKPVHSLLYRRGDQGFRTLTREIGEVDHLDEKSFLYMPYLYQRKVDKRCDVRAFVLGRSMFFVRIDSQSRSETKLDFRAVRPSLLLHSRIDPPASVVKMIGQFMVALGLQFGMFDFVLDQDGNWVFLEVNEQGNWLWLEEELPELPLVDCFIKFLVNADPNYVYPEAAGRDFKLDDYRSTVDHRAFASMASTQHNPFDDEEATVE